MHVMPVANETLPVTDARLSEPSLDLAALARHWESYGARRSITAEGMVGADRKAQRLGVPGRELMEQAGTAVAAAARALLNSTDRVSSGQVLILAGPGNNGGDAFVAARRLADANVRSYVVLVSAATRPGTPDAAANWDRLDGIAPVQRMHAASGHDVAILLNGIERAALVIDGLLGTGVRGSLREPVAQAVEVCLAARKLGVPILSIDTPTALDLSSGEPSEPNVQAHLTVTFHRPKQGLLTRTGRVLAGRVLVAPIGIPVEADHD
ncbi:MAG: ADP-dependent NAD(P)H-hydrate dehydratase / NAD(P)H-hydrate epimerase [Chloroflexota bacterium]|jgi:NAD(P)H-hydrate epimerase|nr:ADP-dependent NAD(P)H-hydrate dehydratase / NAD(P)H-hydrate epimerase [Chloroflexota bacterium]